MRHCLTYVGILLVTASAWAAETNAPPFPMSEPPVVTDHALKVDGKILNYTVMAGYLPLKNEAGKPQADIFFIAYTRDGVDSPAERPITFAFNGGPGASSMWLHLGGLGPKRVVLADDGLALPATYRLVDNDQTWLGFTDLVFVDPIGTGYSRTVPGVNAEQFYNVPKDVDVASRFIREYATKYKRWLSPKYVVGESYGTTRAAALANHLQTADGLNLTGVILLSSALSFQTFSYDDGNDIAFALAVPTFAAAATYHKKATADLKEAEKWALGDYLMALAKGDTLTKSEEWDVTDQMAKYTGLSTNYIATSQLRVSAARFAKELLRSEGRTIGFMDSRVAGVDVTPRGEYPHFDPSFFLTTGPFVATLNDYVRRDLGFQTNIPYDFLSQKVNAAWKWVEHGQGYAYVADDLAEAMTRDTHLRVFAAAGRYDLTTPYLSQRYTFDHMGLNPSLRHHLTFKVYPTGHQIYTDPEAAKQLRADIAAFVSGDKKGETP
jgi:carboxypeptidase C (cathepsin A)